MWDSYMLKAQSISFGDLSDVWVSVGTVWDWVIEIQG